MFAVIVFRILVNKPTSEMTGGKVDFTLIREATRIDLVKLLDKLPGTKVC